jgi:nucleotide-binding universal stress UspA family protein
MQEVKYVLAPIDFSHECRAGLRAAIFLARELGAPLELLHVDPRILSDAEEVMLRVSYQKYEAAERRLEAEAAKKMDDMIREEGGGDLKPQPSFSVLGGDPAHTIVRHAHQHERCVIVITKKSSSAVADLVLGSVTHKVVCQATVPVLVLHCRRQGEE